MATLAVATPCSDPARTVACPDLVMRRPYGMRLLAGRFLAATNAIVNVGDGPLEIRARRVPGSRTQMRARQVLRGRYGHPTLVRPVTGTVELYDTRGRGTYWKFRNAASFTLRPVAADGTVGPIARTGPKVDYCFRDLRRVARLNGYGAYPGSPQRFRFGACSTTPRATLLTLGTSVGWADIYPWGYPQNAIDVAGLRGCFAYTLKVDPKDELDELDETNNAGTEVVRLPWRGPGRRGCPAPAVPPS
jgi:hypothetical protein